MSRVVRPPKLAVMLVGNQADSSLYVQRKLEAAERCGIESVRSFLHPDLEFDRHRNLPDPAITELIDQQMSQILDEWNSDDTIDGCMIQLPLPSHRLYRHLHRIDPSKDVDGLSQHSMGKLAYCASKLSSSSVPPTYEQLLQHTLISSNHGVAPSTKQKHHISDTDELLSNWCSVQPSIPAAAGGIFDLIHRHRIELIGRNVLIVGSSPLLGLPLSLLCLAHQATVTVAHAATVNLSELVKTADIIITAVGQPGIIHSADIKLGCIVLDAGCTVLPDQPHPIGDIDFDSAVERCSLITPVPGGVGPCTIARLLSNVTHSWKRRLRLTAEDI